MPSTQRTKFEKNALDLEHKKLLSEYNTLLIALASVTLGMAGLVYTLTSSLNLSLTILVFTCFVINSKREDKSKELDKKVEQIRDL